MQENNWNLFTTVAKDMHKHYTNCQHSCHNNNTCHLEYRHILREPIVCMQHTGSSPRQQNHRILSTPKQKSWSRSFQDSFFFVL